MVEGQRSRPTTGLSPDEKRKMVDDALEYALDAAVTERPANLLQFVSGKLREWGPERERLRAAPHRHTRLVLNAGDDGAVKLQMDVLPVPVSFDRAWMYQNWRRRCSPQHRYR